MKISVEQRGGYRSVAMGLSFPEAGMEPVPGADFCAAAVTHASAGGSIVGILDSIENCTEPVHTALRGVLSFISRRLAECGMPPIKAVFVIDAHGRVDQFTPGGRPDQPVVILGWPASTVDAFLRFEPAAPLLWMELVRVASDIVGGVVDPQQPLVPLQPERFEHVVQDHPVLAASAQHQQYLPSAGMGATVIEGQALCGATIVAVSHDARSVMIKRDMLLGRDKPADVASVGNYVPAGYAQTEIFVREPNGWWCKRGSEASCWLLVGARLCATPTWRLV